MAELNSGITLMIQFKCGRCGKKHLQPYHGSSLVPSGWKESGKLTPLLCPECHKAFNEFMKAGDPDGSREEHSKGILAAGQIV